MTGKIPDEAVEAAAKVGFELNGGRWDDATDAEKRSWRVGACIYLEAAAPHLAKPRTITTAEELDALPAKSVILDPDGTPWVSDGDTVEPWASVCEDPYGGPIWKNSRDIAPPATVLYEPQP